MEQKKLFGVIRYLETENGDRLTKQSVKDTVHIGMTIGLSLGLGFAFMIYHFLTKQLGQTVGVIGVIVFFTSWSLTSYLSYSTVCEKVESVYRSKGEFYE